MLQKAILVPALSSEERQQKMFSVLQSAQDFNFAQASLVEIQRLHECLCEAVELGEASSWNNQFVLAELKSWRLACCCRIEAKEALSKT